MARETVHENEMALALLRLKPTDHVLEVGFGHGRTIQSIAGQVPAGRVAGTELSTEMLRLAGRANRDAIIRGLVGLKQGDRESLPTRC